MSNKWNGWTLASDEPAALVWSDNGYYIELDRCLTSSMVLDWIFQVQKKTWADGACMAGLLQAFDDVLDPQATMCSLGKSMASLTPKRVAALVERAVKWGAPLTLDVGV